MRAHFFPLFALLGLSSCVSQLASLKGDDKIKSQQAIDDLRMEVAELKHTLHAYQVDMQILEEKLSFAKKTPHSDESVLQMNEKLLRLESSLAQLQRFQESCIKDLKNLHEHIAKTSQKLSSHSEQMTSLQSELSHQQKNLEAVKDLKTTLSSLKKAISSEVSLYKVKQGDTLEKIARRCNLRVEELRALNQLESDTIKVGQELKIPQ